MFAAHGWIIVRSSRDELRAAATANLFDELDDVDERIEAADQVLFDQLEAHLESVYFASLDYSFTRQLNHQNGILRYSSASNHRGDPPAAIGIMEWIGDRGPDSYGVVFVHDDEDVGETRRCGRSGEDYSGEFRVWVLKGGVICERDDTHLSPAPMDP